MAFFEKRVCIAVPIANVCCCSYGAAAKAERVSLNRGRRTRERHCTINLKWGDVRNKIHRNSFPNGFDPRGETDSARKIAHKDCGRGRNFSGC